MRESLQDELTTFKHDSAMDISCLQ